jgi:acetolactate synthase-1/2/3 large subunit
MAGSPEHLGCASRRVPAPQPHDRRGNAYLDRSPLLAITCNLPTPQIGRRIQMAIDHHALFRPITKATLALREGRVASVLTEALEIALSEPLGPVHLDLPEDVALAPASEATSLKRRRVDAASEASLQRQKSGPLVGR